MEHDMPSGRAAFTAQALHGAHVQFAKLKRDFTSDALPRTGCIGKRVNLAAHPLFFYINVFYALFRPGIGIGSRFSITAMNITNRTVLTPISSHSLLIGRYIPATYKTAVTSV